MLRLVLPSLGEAEDLRSDFEVYFEGIDQWNEPGEKLKMNGMIRVGVQGLAVSKLHDAAEFIALGSRREVGSDVGFEDGGDLEMELVDLVVSALFLSFCGSGFPVETKSVDDHGGIVIGPRGS